MKILRLDWADGKDCQAYTREELNEIQKDIQQNKNLKRDKEEDLPEQVKVTSTTPSNVNKSKLEGEPEKKNFYKEAKDRCSQRSEEGVPKKDILPKTKTLKEHQKKEEKLKTEITQLEKQTESKEIQKKQGFTPSGISKPSKPHKGKGLF